MRTALAHSILRLPVCLHRLLICSLIRSLQSRARSFIHSRAHGKEIYVYELNASISYNFNPLCGGVSGGGDNGGGGGGSDNGNGAQRVEMI